MLFALMAAALVMSAALPEAFDGKGLAFGCAFAALQFGRSLFVMWAVRGHPTLHLNFVRISIWLGVSAVLWVAGGLADGATRMALWGGALLIEYVGPAAYFWTPGLGRARTTDWNVEGGHMAERSGLFVIIALGESILVLGATFAKLAWTPDVVAALAAAFIGSLAMWWIYFAGAADAASHVIEKSDDPGRIARRAYTYAPLLLIAGIIVTAVGDELSITHPDGHMDRKTFLVLVGGPGLFLLGSLAFKYAIFGIWSPSRLAGIALLAALAPFALQFTPLGLAAAATGVLLFVAAWETAHLARLKARGEV
jgi:low temperature requirement protein LtrA